MLCFPYFLLFKKALVLMVCVWRKSVTCTVWLNQHTSKKSLQQTQLREPRIVHLFVQLYMRYYRFVVQRKLTGTLESNAKLVRTPEIIMLQMESLK